VVAIRVGFRVLFNFDAETDIALDLPTIHLSFGPLGAVDLLGRVSYTALNSALRDGLRMSAIILSIGLANSLANPRRLLKSTPSALNEVATAFAIAINLAPQLISSSKRVNQAQRLRNLGSKTGVTGLIVPIFEDALERSMALAASMDSRGFGRQGNLSTGMRLTSRLVSFAGAVAFAVGAYLLLTSDAVWATLLLFAVGISGFAASLRIAGIASVKTRYVSQRWASRDWLLSIAALGLVALFVSGVIR
jgi:energy-coupling factor transport system permease protein